MANNEAPAQVELIIPCQPEYVGVARLALLGIASRMPFTYEQIEDLRLAVGELCTSSVEWAQKNKMHEARIVLRAEIFSDKLTVDILDTAGPRRCGESTSRDEEEENLAQLLITLLVDEVEVTPQPEGTLVRMVKYAGQQ
ncbi:MAG: ATP-binding protein [Armatimonadota bacterium]|nr:ATP-binding protein [Armatimonadota bacterium]